MSHRSLAAVMIAIGWLAPVAASGQSQARSAADTAATWTAPRTPDGRPDLQGFWTTQTFTPLERPEHLAGKEFFTEEEAAALRQQFTLQNQRVKGWLRSQPNVELLEIEHRKAISDPASCAAAVRAFLGDELDEDAMAEVVDPRLHRHQASDQ